MPPLGHVPVQGKCRMVRADCELCHAHCFRAGIQASVWVKREVLQPGCLAVDDPRDKSGLSLLVLAHRAQVIPKVDAERLSTGAAVKEKRLSALHPCRA